MSVPYLHSEVLVQDGNFRTGIGAQSSSDVEKILNCLVRDDTKRLLVETLGDQNHSNPLTLYWNEVTVTGAGITISFAGAIRWLSLTNDDNVDDVFMRVGSLTPSTSITTSWRLKAGEAFDIPAERIPVGTSTLALICAPTKVAIVRIGAGLA